LFGFVRLFGSYLLRNAYGSKVGRLILFKRFGKGAAAVYGCLFIIVLVVMVVALLSGWLKFQNILSEAPLFGL
jgi:hypothetical protein